MKIMTKMNSRGGRKKLDLSPEEWKIRKREQAISRKEKLKLLLWEKLVSEIIIKYVEGSTIKDIAECQLNSNFELKEK